MDGVSYTSWTIEHSTRTGCDWLYARTANHMASTAEPFPVDVPLETAWRSGPRGRVRTIIVGTGGRAADLAGVLLGSGGCQVIGAVDHERLPTLESRFPSVRYLGPLSDLRRLATLHSADELCVALPLRSGFDQWREVQSAGREIGLPVSFHFDLIGQADNVAVQTVSGATLVRCNIHPSTRPMSSWSKRVLDVVGAAAALALLSPLFLVVAALVKFTSPGPVFFRQPRVGRGREVFGMLKFRTMVADAEAKRSELESLNDANGALFKIERDPRLTVIAPLLRRTSIDELPQLANVLLGEMSLVGPRPLPVWLYDRLHEPEFNRRHAVLPGMTGLWQVSGRRQSFGVMKNLDLKYVDEWSLWMDLRILLRTLPAVLRRGEAQ